MEDASHASRWSDDNGNSDDDEEAVASMLSLKVFLHDTLILGAGS